jgi:hypothetical protein
MRSLDVRGRFRVKQTGLADRSRVVLTGIIGPITAYPKNCLKGQNKSMRKLITWLVFVAVYVNFITQVAVPTNAQIIGNALNTKMKDLPDGLKFRLSEGVEGAETRAKQPLAPTDPLADNDTTNLLKRIPEIKASSEDQTDFAKRIGTLPAPKTGNKIPVQIPGRRSGRTAKDRRCETAPASIALFTRRRSSARTGSQRHLLSTYGCRYVAGAGSSIRPGRTHPPG